MQTIPFLLLCVSLFQTNMSNQCVDGFAFRSLLKGMLSHSVTEICVQDLAASTDDIVFLDARAKKEYEVSHIKGAIWVGYDDFSPERVIQVNKKQKIVVYCSIGYRSEKISEKLIALGYQDVANLYGGIFEWVNQEKPVYQTAKKTNHVHAFSKSWGVWLRKGKKVY